jgi:glucosylceramidase
MHVLLRLCAVGLVVVFLASVSTEGEQRMAMVWQTTGDRTSLLSRVADVPILPPDATTAPTLELFPAQAYQRIFGFGASLTESSAYLLHTELTDLGREQLMDKFFDRETGAGLGVVRQPIGASDFALDHYSYNDLPAGATDFSLAGFSIERDRAHVLPALKQAIGINPDLVVIASPWSAPGWMKDNGSMVQGRLRTDRFSVFAQYLARFVKAYEAEGVPIDWLTVANEPLFSPKDYPGMYMPAADQATLIGQHVGPAFAKAGITTQILTYDQNWKVPEYPNQVLADAVARPYIKGVAFHCYAGVPSMMDTVHAANPDRPIHVTECSSFSTNKTFAANLMWNARVLVIDSIRHWAESVVAWNLVLDENGGPRTGGCPDCTGLATINRSTGTISFNGEYYALAHASKFIAPGARRIGTTGFAFSDLEGLAVKNPDGSNVMLITNSGIVARRVKVRLGTEETVHQVPAMSVTTVVWPAGNSTPEPEFDATQVPAIIQAEAFGNGGAGISYHDLTPGNLGAQYRNTDVDIESTNDTGGGYNVGWLRPGEWMSYPIDVSTSETYTFEARVASNTIGGAFHIEIDGVDRTGKLAIPNTGGWQSWVTLALPDIPLTAGRRDMRVVIDAAGASGDAGNINFIRISKKSTPPSATPFSGTPLPIPGTAQAEMFDNGPSDIAYRDHTLQNLGAAFRMTAVDIQPAVSGGFNVGWTQAGEWLQYTMQVATSGAYLFAARVASQGQGGTFHIEAAGKDVSGPVVIPNTGGWQVWQTVSASVTLAAGTQPVRLIFDTNAPNGSVGNVDWIAFSVPKPSVNLAVGRPVSASSVQSASYAAAYAVDGKTTTRWSSAFSDPQWITVDLGAVRTVQQITLRWETAHARSYQLQVSNDSSKWTTVWSTTTGDGAVDTIANLAITTRYVRMYASQRATTWGHSLWEFEVYGEGQ